MSKAVVKNDIDAFVEFLIKETCEGCTLCEPSLDARLMPEGLVCMNEGTIKWLLEQKERFKKGQ